MRLGHPVLSIDRPVMTHIEMSRLCDNRMDLIVQIDVYLQSRL